jgi:hypothetical protein
MEMESKLSDIRIRWNINTDNSLRIQSQMCGYIWIRFCRFFFSIRFHMYSAISGTIYIRLYKTASCVYN